MRERLAKTYGDLGTIFKNRGNPAKSRTYYERALELYEQIGTEARAWKSTRENLAELDELEAAATPLDKIPPE